MTDGTTTDMTGGLYRRIYAGFITGKRINAVSWGAEAWFWRLHAIADDFGNLPGDPIIMRAFAAPRRDLTIDAVISMTAELTQQRLIMEYQHNGDSYVHIDGFESRQPAGKNGKRIQRHPIHPGCIQVNPGESKIIQVNPVASEKSCAPDTDTDNQSDSDSDSHYNTHPDTDRKKTVGCVGYMEKPETASGRAGQPFVQVFILKVAEAFRWTSVTAMEQRKSLSAVARKLLKESDRDELAKDFIALARDKADDPALEKPVAAWQAEVTRILTARTKRKDW